MSTSTHFLLSCLPKEHLHLLSKEVLSKLSSHAGVVWNHLAHAEVERAPEYNGPALPRETREAQLLDAWAELVDHFEPVRELRQLLMKHYLDPLTTATQPPAAASSLAQAAMDYHGQQQNKAWAFDLNFGVGKDSDGDLPVPAPDYEHTQDHHDAPALLPKTQAMLESLPSPMYCLGCLKARNLAPANQESHYSSCSGCQKYRHLHLPAEPETRRVLFVIHRLDGSQHQVVGICGPGDLPQAGTNRQVPVAVGAECELIPVSVNNQFLFEDVCYAMCFELLKPL